MKGNELKIGNWIRCNNLSPMPEKVFQCQEVLKNSLTIVSQNFLNIYLEPILLTQEWLLKFGFETDNIEWWNGILSIGIYKDGLFFCPTGEISLRIGKEIQYVHQLQNLYFVLTGKELILNQLQND